MKLVGMSSFCMLVAACLFAAPQSSAQSAGERRAAWLRTEPLVIVGNWDSMPIFRRRVGGQSVSHDEQYLQEHSEDAVRKLKELGVTMAVIHFYKGFGLAAEKAHMEEARALAGLCKKYGLRVGVYVGSTIGYETFLAEAPEAESWFVPRFLGRPVVYGSQTFRKRVYFMHDGYRQYMKRVLRIAVEDLKADLIHFDNTSLQARPEVFLHPQAVKDFRRFLRDKYSPQLLEQRLGFSEVRFVEPPELERPPVVIDDPLLQEWADFRCAQLAAYYREMADYIRRLNPEVAVEANPHSGISGVNTVWEQGVDYPRLLRPLDVVWTEERGESGVDDGILVSKIRTYKMAAQLNNRVFTYTGGSRGGKVALAEAMAYNRKTLGMVGGMLAGSELPDEQRRYVRFFLDHFDLYRDVSSRADVAVLHSFASMAYNSDIPWRSSMLFEQALIQAKVPFDIVFDENLNDLSKYRVLALPDQECLSEEQLGLIRKFVEEGGGVVATGASSLFDQWRRRRRDFGLQDLFRTQFADAVERRNQIGRGRVAYIPRVEPAIEKPAAAAATSRYWRLPRNWQELIAAVRWAAGGSFSAEVKAPLTVAAELLEDRTSDRVLLHLINYDAQRAPQVRGIPVSLAIPAGKRIRQVSLLSPDAERPESPAWALKSGRIEFTVPVLRTYAVAAVQLGN